MQHVSVVVPVFGNSSTVDELYERLSAALGDVLLEVVFVDDACPAGSGAVLARLASREPRVRVVTHAHNQGQNEAILSGFRTARGEIIAVMDADLQDPPEAVPRLLARLDADADVVFADRRGRYEGLGRLATGKFYRRWIAALTGLPRGATLFLALRRSLAERLGTQREARPYVLPMIAFAGARTANVPVERAPRADGRSAYAGLARVSLGLSITVTVLQWRLLGLVARLMHRDPLPPVRSA
jgi:hypothetical protein